MGVVVSFERGILVGDTVGRLGESYGSILASVAGSAGRAGGSQGAAASPPASVAGYEPFSRCLWLVLMVWPASSRFGQRYHDVITVRLTHYHGVASVITVEVLKEHLLLLQLQLQVVSLMKNQK